MLLTNYSYKITKSIFEQVNVFLLITPIKIRRSVVTATKAEYLPSAEKSSLGMATVASY
jgi:hypothetical protein